MRPRIRLFLLAMTAAAVAVFTTGLRFGTGLVCGGEAPAERSTPAAGAIGDAPAAGAHGGEPAAKQPARSSAATVPAAPRLRRIPFLGTATTEATPQQRTEAGLAEGVGLYVQYVLRDSPAEVAGLQRGDVLYKLDDQLLINDPQFRVLLRMRRPAETVQLSFRRGQETYTVAVRLGEREVPEGDLPASELLRWLLRRAPADAAPSALAFSANYEDDEHVLMLSTDERGTHLVAKDKQGRVVFDGFLNTAEQRRAVPPQLEAKLKRLETPPQPKTLPP